MTARARLAARLAETRDRLFETTARLVRTPSANPPGDTTEIAAVCAELLSGIDGVEVSRHMKAAPVDNLVAVLRGSAPGRRLVFNGHLDTYPAGDPSSWTGDPLSGEVRDGRIYGRGVSDMKGGIACSMLALALMAECRGHWGGEIALTLAGDEETMGTDGTAHLIETVPEASGDAVICGDAGSPRVLRFGEKGLLWISVTATGAPAHGAHVHLGRNAVEILIEALDRLRALTRLEVAAPPEVARAVARAACVSEAVSGPGETAALGAVTVNIGTVEGGRAQNLVADRAQARLDLRIPAGLAAAALEAEVAAALAGLDGVAVKVQRRYDPSWTDPGHEIVRLAAANAAEALGEAPAVTMRIGASDCRLYRAAGMPAVVCGPTPHNMGAGDEHVLLSDLEAVAAVHTLTAFDYLARDPGRPAPSSGRISST